MKITIEVEAPDFHTVPGLAAQVAPEVARLVSAQVHGTSVVVVSATESDSETDYALAEEPAPKPKRARKPRTAKPKD